MPYLLRGNAQDIFSALACPHYVSPVSALDFPDLNLEQAHFLGTAEEEATHNALWQNNLSPEFYVRGNLSGEVLKGLFGSHPLKKANEAIEAYTAQFICQHFAFVDDQGESNSLLVMTRRDDPTYWAIGLLKKGYLKPQAREVILLSSFDLQPWVNKSFSQLKSVPVPLANNPLVEQLGAKPVADWVNAALQNGLGAIDLRCARINLLLRTIKIPNLNPSLAAPAAAEFDLSLLFNDNPVLDLLLLSEVYKDIPLSPALIKECLDPGSGLYQELQQMRLSEDLRLSKNLLKMTLVFYEAKILDKQRHLLADHKLIEQLGGFMEDEIQICLIPFLQQKGYSVNSICSILADKAYYQAVSYLVEMGFTQDLPTLLANPEKLNELQQIYAMDNPDCQRLCLVFWVKAHLSADKYSELAALTKRYPLLASTLVSLDKEGSVINGIDGLWKLAHSPHQHVRKAITHHFFADAKAEYQRKVYRLPFTEAEKASTALGVLRQAGCAQKAYYALVLEPGLQGKLLRIFLPQIAAITPKAAQHSLIEVLYKGVVSGIPMQGNMILAIKNKDQQQLASALHKRFICVRQMHDLKLDEDLINWTAKPDSQKAQRFRHIILRVEDQCKKISGRLSESANYQEMHQQWQKQESKYRKKLYEFAYETLNPKQPMVMQEIKARVKEIEQEILAIIDPPTHSEIYKAFIVISNILITALSLGIANYIKGIKTGNFWFFNQSTSGEEIRALDKHILKCIDLSAEELSTESAVLGAP